MYNYMNLDMGGLAGMTVNLIEQAIVPVTHLCSHVAEEKEFQAVRHRILSVSSKEFGLSLAYVQNPWPPKVNQIVGDNRSNQ